MRGTDSRDALLEPRLASSSIRAGPFCRSRLGKSGGAAHFPAGISRQSLPEGREEDRRFLVDKGPDLAAINRFPRVDFATPERRLALETLLGRVRPTPQTTSAIWRSRNAASMLLSPA